MGEAKLKGRVVAKLAAEISQAELACRIFEIMSNAPRDIRPYPRSPEMSMEVVKREDPEIFRRTMAAAEAAVIYVVECINAAQVPS